jgi:uncharacterized cupin superfamily protein
VRGGTAGWGLATSFSCPRGRRGAHALANRSDESVRHLMVSTKVMPEVVEYPQEGTVRLLTRASFDGPSREKIRTIG